MKNVEEEFDRRAREIVQVVNQLVESIANNVDSPFSKECYTLLEVFRDLAQSEDKSMALICFLMMYEEAMKEYEKEKTYINNVHIIGRA